jgi:AAA domain (dynein-related subfamily)
MNRVLASVDTLAKTELKRAGALLPGFFALKRRGLNETNWTKIPPSAFSQLVEDFFSVKDPPDPKRPFFNPLIPFWPAQNWPLGSIQTRFQDTTPLAKKKKLSVRGSGQNYEWKLEPGYEEVLADYVEASGRIPYTDFVAWVYREKSFDDDRTIKDLEDGLRADLNLTDDEFHRLFVTGDEEDESDFFSDDDWDSADLTAQLPPPDASPDDEGNDVDDEDEIKPPPAPPPPDGELVAEIVRHMRDTARFDVDEDLIRNFLSSLRTDRFATLIGKTGTGKTEFVKAFARGLEKALAGTGIQVHLVDVEVGDETAEHDLIGYRSLDGSYVPSSVIERLEAADPDRDIYIVLLDEMNLAPIDTYAGKLIASIENNLEIDLPGSRDGTGAATTPWLPPRGACVVGTMNSYLEDSTRKMLSRPITRRTQPIEMPDRLESVASRATSEPEAARAAFDKLVRLVLDQRADRLQEIGVSALDGDRVALLQADTPVEVVDLLWEIAKVLAGRPDVAMTLGPLQDALEYVQTSVFSDPRVALDIQITQKLLPMVRGDAEVLDQLDTLIGAEFTRTKNTIGAMRAVAADNQDRIRPLF